MGPGALSAGGESLLVPALVLSAIGATLVAVLLHRLSAVADERSSLSLLATHMRELHTVADRHRLTLERLPDPVVLRGPSRSILLSNAAFDQLIGPVREGSDASAAEPEIVEIGTRMVRPDGTTAVEEAIRTEAGTRWFSWTETEIVDTNGIRWTLRSGREITDRIANERAVEEARQKAEAASEAKSRFLATVSHEFRTPLNGILGMSDLLLDTRLEPEQTTYVQALRSSAEAFLSLIEEILDFSRIEAGRIDLTHEPFEIEPLVQGVVELLAPRAQDKGTEIACFVGRDVPRVVVSDRDRLRQVLFNLAGNAVKFTDAGGVCVSVERAEDGGIVFAVEDTGPGIPSDRLSSIFEEFEQGGLQTARGTGTGLGLAITRRIVDRMDGRIAVESTPGRGSVFRVTLPLAPAADLRDPDRNAQAEGLRVILLGSSAFEPLCLERRLTEAGAETARATSVEEAGALMRGMRFDVLIADGALGEAGVRMASRAAREAGIGRTIVLLSPFERRDFGSPHAAGFDAYLVKPVRARSLFDRLRGSEASASRRSAAPMPLEAPPRGTRRARVLLAEDNEVNALLAMKALEKLGAHVEWARDGLEALDLAQAALRGERAPYDLVLMDMRMPGMDGMEVTRRVRECEAASGRDDRCRIVALTASIVGQRERYRETAGFDGFLTKPFTLDALAAQLGPASDGYAPAPQTPDRHAVVVNL